MIHKVFALYYRLFLKAPGAENETRTRDPNLGKVVLYQLSYFRNYVMNSSNYAGCSQPVSFSVMQMYDENLKIQISMRFFCIFLNAGAGYGLIQESGGVLFGRVDIIAAPVRLWYCFLFLYVCNSDVICLQLQIFGLV